MICVVAGAALLSSLPLSAAPASVGIAVASDGTPTFDPNDDPGDDGDAVDEDSSPEDDDPAEDDIDTATVGPTNEARNRTLEKSLDEYDGTTATWAITVGNAGDVVEPGPIVVTDALPAGLDYVSSSGAGWTCTADGWVLTCEFADDLLVGASTPDLLVVTTVTGDAGATIENAASTPTVSGELVTADNDSDASLTVPTAPATTTTTTTAAPTPPSRLALTGGSPSGQVAVALLLFVIGAVFIASGRRQPR